MSYEFFSYENLIILVHLLAMLQFLCNDWLRQNLRHLYVVSAKTGLTRPQDRVQGNQPSVDLMKYLFN